MDSIYPYLTRIVPALSLLGVVFLLISSFILTPYGKTDRREHYGEATKSQLILGVYTSVLHIISVLFAARVCWAMGDVVNGMRESASVVEKPMRRKNHSRNNSELSKAHQGPSFVIIIPAYKEEIETLRETIGVLASHPHARSAYHIFLAMEQREVDSGAKASSLMDSFASSFHRMSYTIHPFDIPGEAAGKSSNESWAAKQAFEDYRDDTKSNIVMTIMDADTHLSPRYFAQISKHHVDGPNASEETIYVPPIVFDRNLQQVPLPVRTADIMWAGAGLSNLYNGSSVCIPTSVYSLPMTLAERVGGWDTGPGAIGEDMHMYLKCFFALSGNLKVKIIYAAASQCNVSSNLEGFGGFVDGLRARYKQALRHMWGALDTGYAVRQAIEMIWRRNKECESIPEDIARWTRDMVLTALSAMSSIDWTGPNGHAGMRKNVISKPCAHTGQPPIRIHATNVCIVFHRLFEAHFLPLHVSLILAAATIFNAIWGSSVPRELSMALYFCSICRLIAWALIVTFFYRYQTYHRLCVELKREDMRKADTTKEAAEEENHSSQIFGWVELFEACIFPLGGFLYGAIPALQAVVSHMATDRITYQVSLKPQISIQCWKDTSRSPSMQPMSRGVRARSDSWRKQAFTKLDNAAAVARYGPMKTEE